MTACEPDPPKQQAVYGNPEPVTGFEHNVTFNLLGTKMTVPYGYLAKASRNNGRDWLSAAAEDGGYIENPLHISVHYRKTEDGWVIEPYNQQNKQHFLQFLKDGLAPVDDIMIKKAECRLDMDIGEKLLQWGMEKIPSIDPVYEAYEDKRHIPENPYWDEIKYIKKGENSVIITHSNIHKRAEDINYSTISCMLVSMGLLWIIIPLSGRRKNYLNTN